MTHHKLSTTYFNHSEICVFLGVFLVLFRFGGGELDEVFLNIVQCIDDVDKKKKLLFPSLLLCRQFPNDLSFFFLTRPMYGNAESRVRNATYFLLLESEIRPLEYNL